MGLLAGAVIVMALLIGGGDPAPGPPAAAETAARLGPAELAGQRLIAGWDGADPPRGLRRMIRAGRVAGLILFADNVSSRDEVRRTIRRLQQLPRPAGLGDPLLVMVDQEGGQVKRLPGPPRDSAATIGERGTAHAREQGRLTGTSLAALGINVDLAPVLDVGRRGSALTRTDRTFGADPERVIAAGVDGFARGLREAGVAATAKHFPGIGAIETNTDLAPQRVRTDLERLRARDELPFAAFAAAGGELVMLSLATYPALSERPAAFARRITTSELRERLGFAGVTITDGLGAAAAQAFGPPRRIAIAAAGAGNDLLLYSDWRQAREAGRTLRRLLAAERLDRLGFEQSVQRVLELRSSLAARSADG